MTNIQDDIGVAILVKYNWPFGRSFRHHNQEACFSIVKYRQSRNYFTAVRKIFWRKPQILKTAAGRNIVWLLLSVITVLPAVKRDEAPRRGMPDIVKVTD
jgi:hypothetical protein